MSYHAPPMCKYFKGGLTHYGGSIYDCTHPQRNSLNGFLGRHIFKWHDCIMWPFDKDDYCPLFSKLVFKRPPPPPGTKIQQSKNERLNTKVTDTLFVNIFGAPGAGKSTTASGVFSFLKLCGINAESVPEYAKDLVWEGTTVKLKNQIYIFGKQYQRLFRLKGKVEVAITDSPILLSTIYDDSGDNGLKDLVTQTNDKMNTLNFFVRRVKEYNPAGRMQTAYESDVIADKIKGMLDDNNIEYTVIDGNEQAMVTITKIIFEKLRPGLTVNIDLKINRENVA